MHNSYSIFFNDNSNSQFLKKKLQNIQSIGMLQKKNHIFHLIEYGFGDFICIQ